MKNFMKSILEMRLLASTLVVVFFVTACGGGGGNPGTSSAGNGSVGTSTTPQSVLLSLELQDQSGRKVASVPASSPGVLVATLANASGTAVVGEKLSISGSFSTLFNNTGTSSAVTDANGQARFVFQRSSLSQFGSASVIVSNSGQSNCTGGQGGCYASTNAPFVLDAGPPILQLEWRDASNAPTNSIDTTGLTTLRAMLKFLDGTPVVQKRIDVTGDLSQIALPNGASQLTDASGIASIKVTRASLSAKGAGTVSAQALFAGVNSSSTAFSNTVSANLDYQVGDVNITLNNLNVGSGSLQAYGNRTVTVQANVNGVATTTPVQVSFNASCGTIAPATIATNGSGVASATYKADSPDCQGTNVTISASVVGANSASGTVQVAAPVASNVQFVSANPQLIYIKGSVGQTQSQVTFKVVDANGNGLPNKNLQISLSNLSTGVSLNSFGSSAPVTVSTDSAGNVSVPVFAGTVPSSLTVKAALLDTAGNTTNVSTNSNVLAVASGLPVQRSLSVSVEKFAIEGFNVDGPSTNVTLSLADRQGNPVPPGTQVNFVSEGGVFQPAVCFIPQVAAGSATNNGLPSSNCTVSLRAQGTRTVNGRVSILAYTAGEEDFVDLNGNNAYDSGEPYTDLGRAYRDDNSASTAVGTALNGQTTTASGANFVLADRLYNEGEFQVPRIGVPACTAGIGCTGDGVWGVADVRAQGTVVFSTSAARFVSNTLSTNFATIWVSDLNNNSMPTGSTVSAIVSNNDNCKLSSVVPGTISNSLEARLITVSISPAAGFSCTGATVTLKVITPLLVESLTTYTAP